MAATLAWYFAWIQVSFGVAALVFGLRTRTMNPAHRFFGPFGLLFIVLGAGRLTMSHLAEPVWFATFTPAFAASLVWGIQTLRRTR